MWLTRLALRYPVSTALIAITILILGIVSFTQLPVDLLPNITIPIVSVITFYSGAGPIDMEQTVTVPIERTVSSVNDVNYVQSTTREGVCQVRVNFNWGANTDVGMVDVVQRINRVLNILPTGINQPIVLRFDITSLPVCAIAVSGDMDERDLYDIAYNVIEPQIEHLPGVAFAQVTGGRIREIHVTVDRNRLQAMQLPILSVVDAVAQSNLILPSGDLKTGRFDYSLKTESQFNLVKPMGNVVVKTVNGVPIRLKDVASIEDSYQEQTEVIRVDGRAGVILRVQKLANANTIDVVDGVIRAIPKLNNVPAGVRLSLSFDQALYIRQSISGLQHEAVLGAILAMVVILIFLRNIRGTSIIFVAIPLAIMITFIFFRFGDVTLNIMTFGGLALAVGRLVDDSVVELEVISRHYSRMREGQTKLEATLDAAKEVAAPIFVSTLTTVIVFLPVVFLTGVAKLLFVPLTITIAVSLFGSFFVSRTITPLMCLNFLPPERVRDPQSTKLSDRIGIATSRVIESIEAIYQRNLEWALKHRRTIVFSVAGATVATLGMWVVLGTKFIGTEFFPDQDEGQFSITIRTPVGTRDEETQKIAMEMENIVRANVPEMEAMITDIGVPSGRGGNLFGRNSGSHAANIQVALVPVGQRKRSVFEVVNALRPKLQTLVGAQAYINPGGFLRFLLNFGSSAPIDVEVRGYDLDAGMRLAREILAIVRETPGATDALISREDNLPELRVQIDRDKAGILGITASQISNTITTCINGTDASVFTDPVTGNQYNILVRLNEDYRSHVEDLQNLTLTTQSGQPVLLGSLARIEKANSPVQVDRKYQQRLVEVTANVTGRDLGSVANDIRAKLAGIAIPPGFEIRMTGNIEQQGKTFSDLLLAFALAILLVYVVMASQFQSLLDPFVIMFTVPLGFIGVLWMLFFTNTTLSVTSFQGVIVMVGIVVSNGILLVDYTNHRRRAGEELHVAVVRAGRTRLRPILMTTLATVLGLIPLAMGIGGESSQAPLAIAIIGGLTVSTFLTLLFIPTIYTIFEERVKRGNKQLKPNEAGSE